MGKIKINQYKNGFQIFFCLSNSLIIENVLSFCFSSNHRTRFLKYSFSFSKKKRICCITPWLMWKTNKFFFHRKIRHLESRKKNVTFLHWRYSFIRVKSEYGLEDSTKHYNKNRVSSWLGDTSRKKRICWVTPWVMWKNT